MTDTKPTKKRDTTRSIRMPDGLWQTMEDVAAHRTREGYPASRCTATAVVLDVLTMWRNGQAPTYADFTAEAARVAGKE